MAGIGGLAADHFNTRYDSDEDGVIDSGAIPSGTPTASVSSGSVSAGANATITTNVDLDVTLGVWLRSPDSIRPVWDQSTSLNNKAWIRGYDYDLPRAFVHNGHTSAAILEVVVLS